jgi:periplasmic protein TonB
MSSTIFSPASRAFLCPTTVEFSRYQVQTSGLRRCAVICAVFLALLLSPGLSQSAPAPDSPKQEAPPAQEAPKPKVMRIRIGGNVAKSQLKHKVQPQYPQEARDNRVQGTVRLHVVLSTAGKVQQLEVVSGDPILAKAALEAVRQWEYKPTLLNGEPVEVDTTVDVVFSLVQ